MSKNKEKKSNNLSFLVQMDPPKKRSKKAVKSNSNSDIAEEASYKREASRDIISFMTLFRLITAACIFVFVIIVNFSDSVEKLMLLAALLLAGTDILFYAVVAVIRKDFLDENLFLSFSAIVAFIIGFAQESIAFIILYQVFKLIVAIIKDTTLRNAFDLIDKREDEIRSLLKTKLEAADSTEINTEASMLVNVRPALIAAAVLAVIYALALPLFAHYNIRISVHRALSILLIVNPFSITAAMPLIGRIALCYAAANGTVFESAQKLEALNDVKSVVIEKTPFLSAEEPKIVHFGSEVFDESTFLNFVFHIVYESGQSFAEIIKTESNMTYIPGIVSDFSEGAGGVSGKIGTNRAYFGTKSYIESCGLSVPDISEIDGIYYYLFFAGRYVGIVVLSEVQQVDIGDIIHNFRVAGVNKCILVCRESSEEISSFATTNRFDDVYSGLNDENREELINNICQADTLGKVFITEENDEEHSAADVQMHVGYAQGNADSITYPNYFQGIPVMFMISRRITEIAIENSVFAFLMKAFIIFLSMTGYCNLWVAVSLDMAAAIITILNTNRVTSRSLISTFLNK